MSEAYFIKEYSQTAGRLKRARVTQTMLCCAQMFAAHIVLYWSGSGCELTHTAVALRTLPRTTMIYTYCACCQCSVVRFVCRKKGVEAKKSNFVVTHRSSLEPSLVRLLACLFAPFVCIFVYRISISICTKYFHHWNMPEYA